MLPRVLAFGFAMALATPAWASPITVLFTAEVSSANPDRYPEFDFEGNPPTISGSLTYESEVSGSGSVTGPPYGGELVLGATTVSDATVSWDVLPGGCTLSAAGCVFLGLRPPGGAGTEVYGLFFGLPLSSSALPDPTSLAGATVAAFLHLSPTQPLLIAPTLTSLSFVPEPGAAVLALGFAGWLIALRRCDA